MARTSIQGLTKVSQSRRKLFGVRPDPRTDNRSATCAFPCRCTGSRTSGRVSKNGFPSFGRLNSVPVSQQHSNKSVDMLRWFIVVFGLLPGGLQGPKKTFRGIMQTVFMSTFVIIMNLLFPWLYSSNFSTVSIFSTSSTFYFEEALYIILFSLSCWTIIISFWNRCQSVVYLLDHCRQLRLLRQNYPILGLKLILLLAPPIYTIITIGKWYLVNIQFGSWMSAAALFISFFWMNIYAVTPGMFYVVMASVFSEAFKTYNSELTGIIVDQKIEINDSMPSKALHALYQRYMLLRDLHEDLTHLLSYPLLCVYICWTYNILNQLFFSIVFFKESGDISILITIAVATLLTVLMMIMMGSTAVGLQREKSLNKMCDTPLILRVGDLFELSRSTVFHILHAVATYLVIFLQFHLLDRPAKDCKA
ncbi:hypothetical protein SK128_024853 [Halocaridina rubra]|uniref:Uncharacterized protein n=1 Tax=Halocaridina rubra TaxID=373956 RepID=A0AAN8XIV7_HALRR